MPNDRFKHRRQSIRLKGYDYSRPGFYFVTICLQGGQCLLGQVVDGEMQASAAGVMVRQDWFALSDRFPNIELDAFVVMPNHIHGIIFIHESPVGAPLVGALGSEAGTRPDDRVGTRPTLGQIVGAYKSITTVGYIRGVDEPSWPAFHKRLWQRNYYEHVVRNERSLQAIRRYIVDNPASWLADSLHPQNPRRRKFLK